MYKNVGYITRCWREPWDFVISTLFRSLPPPLFPSNVRISAKSRWRVATEERHDQNSFSSRIIQCDCHRPRHIAGRWHISLLWDAARDVPTDERVGNTRIPARFIPPDNEVRSYRFVNDVADVVDKGTIPRCRRIAKVRLTRISVTFYRPGAAYTSFWNFDENLYASHVGTLPVITFNLSSTHLWQSLNVRWGLMRAIMFTYFLFLSFFSIN